MMNKFFKWVGIGVISLVAIFAVLIGIAFSIPSKPSSPPPESAAKVDSKPQQDITLIKREFDSILKSMNCTYDKFKDVTFCNMKSELGITGMMPYLTFKGKKPETVPNCGIRFEMSYVGQDWIFFDKVALLIDDKPFKYDLSTSPSRDTVGTTVLETYDVIAKSDETQLLSAIADSKKTEVRLEGKRYETFTFPKANKPRLKNLLKAAELCRTANAN